MTQTEALRLALEALETCCAGDYSTGHVIAKSFDENAIKKTITAIKQALASPVQDPVALMIYRGELCYKSQEDDQSFGMWCPVTQDLPFPEGTKFYTSPPAQRKPLTDEGIKTRTDEQIEATFKRCGGRWNGDHWVIEDADLHPFVRTIEGADLNTLRAISDEYNAWIKHHAAGHSYDDFLAKREAKLKEKNT